MKIIHIVEATATGTLSMVALLANGQASAGHEIQVIYSVRPESPSNIGSLFHGNVLLKNVQLFSRSEKLMGFMHLRRLLLDANPDVVFMHSSFAGFIGRISAAGILRSAKFYYIPHCISFMRSDISSVKRRVFITLEMIAALKRSEFLACSESEFLAIKKHIRFRKCRLIENAVGLSERFDWRARPNGLNRVVTVGQIRAQKGPQQFARIAAAARKSGARLSFVWIGDGEPEAKSELESAGVIVTGWMARPAVVEALREADIYLSTSRWEGMPVAMIEAIGEALPVVASKCPGNVDVVSHGRTGLLFDDVGEANSALLSLVEKPDFARRIARAAWTDAKQRFSRERYIAEFSKLLHGEGMERKAVRAPGSMAS